MGGDCPGNKTVLGLFQLSAESRAVGMLFAAYDREQHAKRMANRRRRFRRPNKIKIRRAT